MSERRWQENEEWFSPGWRPKTTHELAEEALIMAAAANLRATDAHRWAVAAFMIAVLDLVGVVALIYHLT